MSGQYCWTRCEWCMFDDHPGRKHSWAGIEDIEWALKTGRPDPSKQLCGCWCQKPYHPSTARRQLIHKGRKP